MSVQDNLTQPRFPSKTIFPAYVSAFFVFVALSLAPRPTDVSHRRLKKKNLVQKQPNHFADRQSQTYSLASSCAAQTFENRVCNLWLFFFSGRFIYSLRRDKEYYVRHYIISRETKSALSLESRSPPGVSD